MIVTGGSRGIGAATAQLAAARGYVVVISYRTDAAAAERVVASILQRGGRALAIQADVSRGEDVIALFARTDRELGRVTVLVNNAGIVAPMARVDSFDDARVTQMFAVNVVGSFACAREALKRMSTRHGGLGGSIVNVSSAAAKHGSPGDYVDYAASKAAIDVFTIGLAREVAAEGVRVNAVRPGIIRTEIHSHSGDAERPEKIAPSLPMRRPGEAEEVAQAILFLCSNEASYCTGTILDVTGGR